ncbi:hypothetical protein [Phyllobacterium myrsinacearum]|uniref:Phasin domain-containing protein n=1 Tax=Phyllobacterium myrsinacearum TaxID=28101 RepID=A0A839F0F8_9HYPH|nr:hypothetical protein [Phyllobacterium myrsinacearum]MBA8882097.1 hypothetical protein [Phyllobacterium myrsinacearum]
MTYANQLISPGALMNSNPVAALVRQFGLATAHTQAHSVQALMRIQIETLSFYRHRTQQNVKLIDDLIVSEKYQNTFGVLGKFCQESIADYVEEMRTMNALGTRVLAQVATHSSFDVDNALDDMAASTIAS